MTHQTPLDHFCVVDLGNDEVDHILTAVITPEHAPIPTIYQQTFPAPSSPGLTPLVDASPQCWTWFRPSALAAEKKTWSPDDGDSDYENSTAGFPIFHLQDAMAQESGRQCIQGNFNSECECFPVMCCCRRINSLPLVSIKSATPPPASVALSPVLPLNTLSQLLSLL